ncbi:MAG TPA: putative DNA-binding domain-containing protein [Hyphomicrobiaceae bacterium]|nr:putative DNA-binding domain-containing protein [Hyphomicrobiaceae bacterium]
MTPVKLSDLNLIQERMQAAIMNANEADRQDLLRTLKPAAHAATADMLAIYTNAYRSRLAEILEDDLQSLSRYLGDELFAHITSGYIEAHPSDVRNARWFSRHIADFLARTPPFSRWPQVADLATIELALADAFDAPDAKPFTLQDLTATPAETWAHLKFQAHPSVRRLNATTNAYDIWSAIAHGAEPPPPVVLDHHQPLLVWRQDATPKLRTLSPAEALGLDVLLAGASFADACQAMARETGECGSSIDANQAVAWLANWCTSTLLITAP